MVEYIKKFNNLSEADEYVIENIPFIATEMTTGQNICCNSYMNGEPKHISVINDKMLVNNEIWYTTYDGQPYPLEDIIETLVNDYNGTYNGPNILSNDWDSEKNMYVMIFDDDITVLGNIDINTFTAYGPFFITLSDFNIYCYIDNIVLPESVLEIEENTFRGCEYLYSIELPKNLLKIGNYSFYNCSALENITFPRSVVYLGDQVLYGCEGLKSITCEAIIPPYLDDNTPFEVTNNCPIYVPLVSINEYLSDENWSTVSDRINTI